MSMEMDLVTITDPIIIYLRPKLEELDVKPLILPKTKKTSPKKKFITHNSRLSVSRKNSLHTKVKLESSAKLLRNNRSRTKKRYFCQLCSKSYVRKFDLRKHCLSHTKGHLLSCHICNKKFTQVTHLKRHCLTHAKEKLFKCNVCDKSFAQRCHMKRHFLSHTTLKPFQCNRCDRGFYRKDSLTKHFRTHTQDRPYSCELCNKTFGVKYHLKRHYLTHTNEKPFPCDMCNKAFADKNTLVRHLLTHTDESSLSFNEPLTDSSSKKQLVISRETREKPYLCDLCDKTFSRKVTLKNHQLSHTEEVVL